MKARLQTKSADQDPEGEYKPEFVARILQAVQAEPIAHFESPEQFLRLIAETE